jgi:hypothetical protein
LKDPLSRRDFKVLSPLEEFYNSVAARAGLGFPDAVKLARIVMQTLEKATSSELLEKALAALPPGYEELLKSPITDPMSPTFDGLAKAGEQTPTMAQPGSEIDIFQILMAETRAIMGVMEKLRDTSTTQIQIREELLKEAEVRLMAKHKIEENHFHPLLKLAPGGNQLIGQARQTIQDLEHRIEELKQTPREESRFQHLVETFMDELTTHAQQEQTILFPETRTVLPEEGFRQLAQSAARELANIKKQYK